MGLCDLLKKGMDGEGILQEYLRQQVSVAILLIQRKFQMLLLFFF